MKKITQLLSLLIACLVIFYCKQAMSAISDIIWTVPENVTGAFAEQKVSSAMDSLGNIVVVWGRQIGGSSYVQSSRYNNTTKTWNPVVTISGPENTAVFSEVAVDSAGNAIAVWQASIGAQGGIDAARYDVTTGLWSAPVNLAPFGFTPQIAMDNTGNAIVVYGYPIGGPSARLGASRYDITTGAWSTIPIARSNPTFFPDVAMDSLGRATIIWREGAGSSGRIYTARWTASFWDTPVQLDAGTQSDFPKIAMDSVGNAIALWINESATVIQAQRFANGWEPTSHALSTTGANTNTPPGIAMDPDGNALAVWAQNNGSITSIQTSRYDVNSNSWTPINQVQMLSALGDDAETPKIAMDNSGNGVAVWYRVDNLSNIRAIVQAVRYDKEVSGWLPAQDISLVGGVGNEPFVAVNGGGNICVVWGFPFIELQATHGVPIPISGTNISQISPSIQIAAGSDGVGNVSVGQVVVNQSNVGQAVVNTYSVNNNTWSGSNVVSGVNQNVNQVSVAVSTGSVSQSVVSGSTVVVGYSSVNVVTGNQSVSAVVNNVNSVVSQVNQNAVNVSVSVSNNVNVVNQQVVASYVNVVNVMNKKKAKNGQEQFDLGNDPSLHDLYRLPVVNATGEIFGAFFDSLTNQWISSLLTQVGEVGLASAIASDGSGVYATEVWQSQVSDEVYKIRGSRSISQNWILPAKDLSDDGAVLPRVVSAAEAFTMFSWKKKDVSGNWRVQATWYDGYTPWNSWDSVLTMSFLSPGGRDIIDHKLAIDSSGNCQSAWLISDGNNIRVQTARFDYYNKQWSIPDDYISPVGMDVGNLAVSASNTGYFTISYSVSNVVTKSGKQGTEEGETMVNVIPPETGVAEPAISTGLPAGVVVQTVVVNNFNNQYAVGNVVQNVVSRSGMITKQPLDQNGPVTFSLFGPIQPAGQPQNAYGTQELHRYPLHGDLINVLRWTASLNADWYEIYADANKQELLAKITPDCPLQYCHHCRFPSLQTTYYIYAVRKQGVYSTPAIVTIPQK